MNRDRKKQNKPFKMSDFYFYDNKELEKMPEARYGAAAMEMINQKIFPVWALFVYSDLKARANDALPPEMLCLQDEHTLILAPNIEEGVIRGMLIATEQASNSMRTLTSPCGLTVEVRIPKLEHKYVAIEDLELQVARIVKTHRQ